MGSRFFPGLAGHVVPVLRDLIGWKVEERSAVSHIEEALAWLAEAQDQGDGGASAIFSLRHSAASGRNQRGRAEALVRGSVGSPLVGYLRYPNTFREIDDLARAQELCERFERREWPRVLKALAQKVNPLLPAIRAAGFGDYYWVVDQAEYATDVMFRSRSALTRIYSDLIDHALSVLGYPVRSTATTCSGVPVHPLVMSS